MSETMKKKQVEELIAENLNIFQPKLLKLKNMNKIEPDTELDKAYKQEKQKLVQKMKEMDELKKQSQKTPEQEYQSGIYNI
jgi:hypothetical protein